MTRRWPSLLFFTISCGALFALAPSCAAGNENTDNGDGGDVDGGQTDGTGFDLGDKGAPTALAVDPASTALTVTDPKAPPSVALKAIATFSDGTHAELPASWSLDHYDVASVGAASGVVTATGNSGGKVTVTATVGTLTATAVVTVAINLTVHHDLLDPTDETALGAATTADKAVTDLLYPYDKTVFPKGLLGPDVMWNGGTSSDAYLLRIRGESLAVDYFTKAAPPSAITIDTALWNVITSTVTSAGTDGDISVELRRSNGGTAYVSAKRTFRIANANLRGTIHYWAVDRGEIMKINPGAMAPVSEFDAGPSNALGSPAPLNSGAAPTPPWQDNGAGKRCVACHAVSKNGARLASTFSTPRGSTGPIGFVDVATSTVQSIGDYQQNVMFVALNPDGTKALANTTTMKLRLIDAATGGPLASLFDSKTDNHCDPVFSNDGTMMAEAGNVVGGNPVEFTNSDLIVYSFDSATNAFSSPRTIVKGAAAPAHDAIAFPSFSPDSKWIFFQRGDYSRAKYGDSTVGNYFHGNDDLYVVEAKEGAAPIALSALNGSGVLTGDNLHINYQPTVNPIAEGGYFWVVFVSPRDYGNKMVSPRGAAPKDATYSNRKQLWVAAIDASMKGPDPSHPAFRLPGQLLNTVNMNGYWTLSPCIPTPKDGSAASCSAGFECCSGFCRDVGGKPSCVDPPSGCHRTGEACTMSSDCCGDGKCVGGFCAANVPA